MTAERLCELDLGALYSPQAWILALGRHYCVWTSIKAYWLSMNEV